MDYFMNILILVKTVILLRWRVVSVPIKGNGIKNSIGVTVQNITIKNDDEGNSKLDWSVSKNSFTVMTQFHEWGSIID